MKHGDIINNWEDHFDTPDPCALEEIMFEVKHNVVDIERLEHGINGSLDISDPITEAEAAGFGQPPCQ